MNFCARLIRPYGVSEAIVEEYKGLAEILKRFKSVLVQPDGMSDLLKVEAENEEEAARTFERLKHYYDVSAENKGLKIKLLIEPLF